MSLIENVVIFDNAWENLVLFDKMYLLKIDIASIHYQLFLIIFVDSPKLYGDRRKYHFDPSIPPCLGTFRQPIDYTANISSLMNYPAELIYCAYSEKNSI